MKYIVFFSIIIAYSLYSISCEKEVVSVGYVNVTLQGVQCEVYFFKRWGTYSHPVKPIDPIEYEEALTRKGYCRAWMCKKFKDSQFVLFEAKKNRVDTTDLTKPIKDDNKIRFYEYLDKKGGIGRELTGSDTINLDSFLVSFPGSNNYLSLITQKLSYSYQYKYDENGALKQVVLTGDDGDVSTLEY